MKRYISILLILCLLAGCRTSVEESPQPTEAPTPSPVVEPTPTPEATPIPDRRDLTQVEIDRANEAFYWEQITAEGYKTSTPVNGFFRSYYEDVREMDFGAFIGYYPIDSEEMSREESEKVYGISQFREIPAHRARRARLDETLKRYAGITTAELDTSEEIYLDEYDSWYYYASDFDPGQFICEGGRIEGDTVTLWTAEDGMGIRRELTLKKEDGVWHIRSHLPVPMDRGESLEAFALGLTAEEVEEVTSGWGFGNIPETERVVELLHKALLKPTYSWAYEREEEPLLWDLKLRLTSGETITLGAGLEEDVIMVNHSERAYGSCFRSPELYWLLRTEYDSGVDGKRTIDQEALERYREAVEGYLARLAFAPEVRVELTAFALAQENPALNAQVWQVGTDLTTDPPELAARLVGNGYVDSRLRMHPITGDWPENLLVTVNGEALGFRNGNWLDSLGGLDQYGSVEELKEVMK